MRIPLVRQVGGAIRRRGERRGAGGPPFDYFAETLNRQSSSSAHNGRAVPCRLNLLFPLAGMPLNSERVRRLGRLVR